MRRGLDPAARATYSELPPRTTRALTCGHGCNSGHPRRHPLRVFKRSVARGSEDSGDVEVTNTADIVDPHELGSQPHERCLRDLVTNDDPHRFMALGIETEQRSTVYLRSGILQVASAALPRQLVGSSVASVDLLENTRNEEIYRIQG